MTDPKADLVESWMRKAQHDLDSAKVLSTADQPILDTAIYHCQQAAEKALKGYLASREREVPRVHDLGLLVRQAAQIDPEFLQWEDAGDQLTPYSTLFRYPGETTDPDLAEVNEAIALAEKLLQFVLSKVQSK